MNTTQMPTSRCLHPICSVAPVAGPGWRLLRGWETSMVEALPKNDETVEWWNGESWDLCPALNLSPSEFYRTRALPRRPLNDKLTDGGTKTL